MYETLNQDLLRGYFVFLTPVNLVFHNSSSNYQLALDSTSLRTPLTKLALTSDTRCKYEVQGYLHFCPTWLQSQGFPAILSLAFRFGNLLCGLKTSGKKKHGLHLSVWIQMNNQMIWRQNLNLSRNLIV